MGKIVKFRRPNRIKLGLKSTLGGIAGYFFFGFHIAVMFAAGMLLYFVESDNLFAPPIAIVFSIAYLTLSVSFHEFGHSLVAYWAGDYMTKYRGYLHLNFLRYSDSQSIFFALIVFMMSGIFLPAGVVYLNSFCINRKKMLWVHLAGPVADIITLGASINFIMFFTDGSSALFTHVTAALIVIKIMYIFFNLLPIPSLDGYNALAELMPSKIRDNMLGFGSRFGVFVLILVLIVPSDFLSNVWGMAFSLADTIGIPAQSARFGLNQIMLF